MAWNCGNDICIFGGVDVVMIVHFFCCNSYFKMLHPLVGLSVFTMYKVFLFVSTKCPVFFGNSPMFRGRLTVSVHFLLVMSYQLTDTPAFIDIRYSLRVLGLT